MTTAPKLGARLGVLASFLFVSALGASEPAVFPPGADVAWISRGGEAVTLEEHLVPGKVTVVDFWAEWCLPCKEVDREMAAILEDSTDVALRKIDVVDWQTPVAAQHLQRASGLPYLLVFDKAGTRIAVVEGLDLKRLRRAIAKGQRSRLEPKRKDSARDSR